MHPGYQGRWVVLDILPDLIESFIGTNDVLPIVALPHGFSKPFGDCGLECADHHGDGSGMPDPYSFKNQDAVEMIRHHNKRIECNVRKMPRDLIPIGGNNVTHLAENAATIPGADGYEVSARS